MIRYLAGFCLFCLSAVCLAKPNIVIIVADDLGYADMGFKGAPIETPSLDRLAREGLELSRFYTAPICSPTRAALMTGRNPIRLGVAYSVILPWDSGGVHTDERFMSESFQDAGYQTALFGKWHLGHAQQPFHPNARGFDHFYGHLHTETGYYPPYQLLGGIDFQRNGETIQEEGYETFLLADRASEWIKGRDPDKPFLLYMPFLAPHEPLAAPDDLVAKYKDLEDERAPGRSPSDQVGGLFRAITPSRRPLYAAVVDAMDQAIGRVLNTLDEEGLRDNTIVLFFSDNGATRVPSRGGGDNAPLRGGKAETYEGGIRVAALMRWPEQLAAGKKYPYMMSVMDVWPSLAAATGVEVDASFDLDGLNVLSGLKQLKPVSRDDPLVFGSEIPRYGSFNFAAIEERWKLVQFIEQDLTQTRVRNELYDLGQDLGEYNDLAAQHPQLVERLANEIRRWRSLHPINGVRARIAAPPGWRPPLDWASYPRRNDSLQATPARSMAPNAASEYLLDRMLDERGRIIYNCEAPAWLGGYCNPLKR